MSLVHSRLFLSERPKAESKRGLHILYKRNSRMKAGALKHLPTYLYSKKYCLLNLKVMDSDCLVPFKTEEKVLKLVL